MKTKVSGLSRSQAAAALHIDRKTLLTWTAKGLIAADSWTSPGGRVYVGYAPVEVRRLAEEKWGWHDAA